jgi:hypothetical protein
MKQTEIQRKRSTSEPMITGGHQSNAKLSKPPKVDTLHERSRNRLQKRSLTLNPTLVPYSAHLGFTINLYILKYEPYPYNTLPSRFLGVYSTIDSVTSGAFEHGAYRFSREGLLNGSEYLSPTGRINIQSQPLEDRGTEATVSIRSQSLDHDRVIRSDIPHPNAQSQTLGNITRPDIPYPGARSTTSVQSKPKETVFLAIRQGPTAAHCIGVYAKKSLAWGACLKNKANCALSGTLSEESRDVDEFGMPRAIARLHGCGQHVWFVAAQEIDPTSQ